MRFPFVIPARREFDAIGFGTNAVDFLITVPEYPAFNSKVELTEYTQAAGGEVASAMVGLSRLGLRTSYIGKFGNDAAGDFGLGTLTVEGVDVRYAEQIEGARTQIAFIVIDEQSGERTVIWKRDAKLAYSADEVPRAAAATGRSLHFTAHDTAACRAMAGEARAAGTVVSSDIDNVFDGIEDLLFNVDILIVSAEFPARFLGIDEPRRALTEFRSKYGCGIAGVTLGTSGSLLLCGDTFIETPGFSVPGGCRDTTGAGDSFRAGFLYGMLTGESVEVAARMANAVAALKCRGIGARTTLPQCDELSDFLRNS